MPPKDGDTKTDKPKGEPKQPAVAAAVTKSQRMQAHLEGQKKVSFFIPKLEGQPPEYVVNLNGYTVIVPVGQRVEVPEQVAGILDERLRSEGMLKTIPDQMMAGMAKEGM